MGHSPLFSRLARAVRIANFADVLKVSTPEALERVGELEAAREKHLATRREFLGNLGRTAAAAGLGAAVGPVALGGVVRAASGPNVAIAGGGLAGLLCAERLLKAGIKATIYEAETGRLGGRCWSKRAFVGSRPEMAIEHGGQFIDNLHKTMLQHVPASCELGDFGKLPGETDYFVDGQHYHESVIVDAYRAFLDTKTMRDALHDSSAEVYAFSPTDADVAIDEMSIAEFIEPADELLQKAIISAYDGEYGLSCSEQSAFNFVHFIHADKRAKMAWFGVFSDERYYVVEGNDQIPSGVKDDLVRNGLSETQNIKRGHRLTAVRTGNGGIELTFANGAVRTHDAVVITLPFSVLRAAVDLDDADLSPEKRNAIAQLGYGTNAKMAIGFSGRPWRAPVPNEAPDGYNGFAYTSGLTNAQIVFPASPHEHTDQEAILVDYSAGPRGAGLNPSKATTEAEKFLVDLDKVWPGSAAAAIRSGGKLTNVRLDHWPSNPRSLGSYTCYRTGQFTTVAGYEATQEGHIHFAGEHSDSFYSWQGFMEGACLSGIRAANEILADVKAGKF